MTKSNDSNKHEEVVKSLSESVIKDRSISDELKTSFMEYAMSVIVSRALPDAKDGLKPVHRRVLYAAHELGMTYDKPYKKSARLVGEVIGKFHPHGDSAVYDTMVRMAQNFSMRYQLIDGHGNFGSVDGDSPAAMRYTEARLSKIAGELLNDINKNTVDFIPNYDGSENEPVVLPAIVPNLLINGSSGIAVGMATNIPPHNLVEVINGIIAIAKQPDISIQDLIKIIKGPDFPTSALIIGDNGIYDYFSTGKGAVTIRSKVDIESYADDSKQRIIITEIPYMVNKTMLIEKIVDLVKSEQITGISDLRDESSREGIRIVIDVKKDVIPEVLLNHLYKHTQLQVNFNVNMLALENGTPKLLNIKECLDVYLKHQISVLTRSLEYDLRKAKERAHILEGLMIAISNIDKIIKIIRNSENNEESLTQLVSKYNISEIQAKAILEMRLRALSSLESEKLKAELEMLLNQISHINNILSDEALKIDEILKKLEEIKKKYGDTRKTEIFSGVSSDIDDESLIPVEDVVITISANDYAKRLPVETYQIQNRGGVGVKGMSTYSDDKVDKLIITTTHTDLLFFTNKGKVYKIRAYKIPNASRQSKGIPIVNFIQIEKDEKVLTVLPVINNDYSSNYLFMATTLGLVKRVHMKELESIRSNGKIVISLRENDSLFDACITSGKEEIFIGTHNSSLVRFRETDVRPSGRTAFGVTGVKLDMSSEVDDGVVGLSSSNQGKYILTIGEYGLGKISDVNDYRLTRRGSKGVTTMRVNKKTGRVITTKLVKGNEDLLIMTSSGKVIRIKIDKLRIIGRSTSGVKLVSLQKSQSIVSVGIYENNGDLEPATDENLNDHTSNDDISSEHNPEEK